MPKKSETKRTPRRSSRPAVRGNKTHQGRQKASESQAPRREEHRMDMEE
jgi:hypothetical protein